MTPKNTEQPLVSVIIPCYNVSAFVERAIRSIVVQTYSNLEILVIDDASTDDTLQKIRSVKDDRIRVVAYEKNTQKVGAVNETLSHAKGEYICFQDADDWSEPLRLELQLSEFKLQPELGICFTRYRFSGLKKGLPGRVALSNEELRDEFLQFGNKKNKDFDPTSCPTMMITQKALESTGGYHPYFAGRVAEDIQWIYRILKEFKGGTVDKVLYNYSVREGSFTQIQSAGKNAKYAYSWQLLSKIIYKDIHEGIDVLIPEKKKELQVLELESCEEALLVKIKQLNSLQASYENSVTFKIGKIILTPLKSVVFFKEICLKLLKKK
ncbi:glycosyltransferase family A protein [Ferruginibacter paludis]|uniref:glycosyltransferase family 2 protein n=1 Tax=Ferruginibacter paludis TaxID=1310417 RepID=UPI0025B4E025|nr:glycosyltransferase family A protein [Ferruginibacter paludis]MDN3655867.1 glycosyltransferase family A protein [Ferruginibacter paludis]